MCLKCFDWWNTHFCHVWNNIQKRVYFIEKSFFKHLLTERDPRYTYSSGLWHELKAPLFLMTATFNKSLLGLLEKTIGVKVLPNNFLWTGRSKMSRRNISISVLFTNENTHNVKKVLVSNLRDNVHKKAIIYTNIYCFVFGIIT